MDNGKVFIQKITRVNQTQKKKRKKENLNYNNLFFNALKQKSLENYEHSITLFEKCIEKSQALQKHITNFRC